ncbi:MAG TPA: glycine cleavage system protein R [Gammaproteobacteria bacterium]|nr:glycine cleavage system protein R [Gammaproteobacteria bacterium]
MKKFLVLTAVGKDRPGIVKALSEIIDDAGASIDESRMSVLGGEFAVILLVSGESQWVDALEQRIPDIEEQTELTIHARRTEAKPGDLKGLPYSVTVVSMDHPGIVHSVTAFFGNRKINIEELSTRTYAAAHTGTPMFALDMTVNIPGDIRMSQLRQDFVEFCDAFYIDATLEPLT